MIIEHKNYIVIIIITITFQPTIYKYLWVINIAG